MCVAPIISFWRFSRRIVNLNQDIAFFDAIRRSRETG